MAAVKGLSDHDERRERFTLLRGEVVRRERAVIEAARKLVWNIWTSAEQTHLERELRVQVIHLGAAEKALKKFLEDSGAHG